ncbi:unnamed protein product [Schistosoma turkestanicum]|nr:unnamed protein product [Schistosoma turkestanicum]
MHDFAVIVFIWSTRRVALISARLGCTSGLRVMVFKNHIRTTDESSLRIDSVMNTWIYRTVGISHLLTTLATRSAS